MRHLLKLALAAGVLAGSSGLAAAQFDVRIGGGDRYREVERYEGGPRREVVEERVIRRGGPRRTVCRTVIRERVTPGGVVIRRPTEVCRTVVGSRAYVD